MSNKHGRSSSLNIVQASTGYGSEFEYDSERERKRLKRKELTTKEPIQTENTALSKKHYEKELKRMKGRARSASPVHERTDRVRSHNRKKKHRHKDIKQEPDSDEHESDQSSHRKKRKRRAPVIKREPSADLDPHQPIKTEPEDDGYARRSQSRQDGQDVIQHHDKNDKKAKPTEKQKPNFEVSGKLAEDTNTYRGVVIKYNQPPEARKPKTRWRLYPFKGETTLPVLYIHRQSAYLLGRDRLVADIPVDHPSCSKQHAALQFRLVNYDRDDGTVGRRVRPFIIDLESANGTFVNNKRIESRVYVELMEKDVLKFGYSSREYVLLHEQSKDDEADHEDAD